METSGLAPHLTHLSNLFPLALSAYHHTFQFFGSCPSRPPSSGNDSHEPHFPPPADSGARGVRTFQLSCLGFPRSLDGHIASVSLQQPDSSARDTVLLRGLCHPESNSGTRTVGSELLQILLPKQRGSSGAPCGLLLGVCTHCCLGDAVFSRGSSWTHPLVAHFWVELRQQENRF